MRQESKRADKVKNAVAWSFAAELAAKVITPITNMILARILAPEAFGIIATINMVVSFADMFSISGISKYIVQHEFNNDKELFKNADVIFWTNAVISISGWGIIAAFRSPISSFVGNPGYGNALMVAALSLPFSAFASVQEAIFQRKLNYKALFYRRIAVSILPFAITIPLAFLGGGHWAIIIGTLAGNLVKVIILSLSSPWKPSKFYSFSLLKEMFHFCLWMILGAVGSWIITYIDVFLVSNKMGEYYTGLYKNSQSTVVAVISIITAATMSVLFSALSRLQNSKAEFEEMLLKFQKNVGLLVLPIGVGMLCFCDLITKILLGNQWKEAGFFIGIWGLSTALVCVFGDFCKEACKAKGKPELIVWVELLHLLFLIPICQFGLGKGFRILCYIRAFANLEIILLYFIFIKIFCNICPYKMLKNLFYPLLCSFVMGGAGKILLKINSENDILQLFYIFICGALYFFLLGFSKEYREILTSAVFRRFGKNYNKK